MLVSVKDVDSNGNFGIILTNDQGHRMSKQERIFSLEEANQLLPVITELLGNVQKKQERYAHQHDLLFMHELLSRAENPDKAEAIGSELHQEIRELEEAVTDLQKDIKKIQQLGCFVRSVELGLIDFLGRKDGKKVYFCWKLGETAIVYFRHLDSDVKSRVRLDD